MNQELNKPAPPHSGREFFEIDFRVVLNAIRRHPILILACTIIAASAFGVYSARQPKEYRAVAELLIEPVLPKVLGDGFDVEDLGRHRMLSASS